MATVRIHIDYENLKAPLAWSLALHSLLLISLAVSTLLSHSGDSWSGSPGGGSISVKLVGGVPGIPLPRPEVVTPNRVVDTTKGLYKSEPQPKPKAPPPEAKQIPEFTKQKQPRYISRPSKLLEDDTPPPPNAVPYGQGGSPSVPYSQAAPQPQFNLAGSATTGGLGFTGPGGGGDFGGRFAWYVDAVRNRVSSNWLQSTIDPSVRFAPRAVVTFDILRNGSVANVQILQSSGNASVDNSAVRAILGSNPLNPLPGEYSGNKVSVEFWFDFKR
jgi:periplasmic protein TonB